MLIKHETETFTDQIKMVVEAVPRCSCVLYCMNLKYGAVDTEHMRPFMKQAAGQSDEVILCSQL